MGEHKRPRRNCFEIAGLGTHMIRGASLGLLMGALCIGVGIVRWIVFLLSGEKLTAVSFGDLRVAAFYVGGFALAGAVVGGLLPRFRGSLATYVSFALGGMVVAATIVAGGGIDGLTSNGALDWIGPMAIGAVLGIAAVHGWLKRP
jgi:hypothetical protein